MAGEFDGGNLHPQANAQIGHFVLAGKTGGADLAFNAPLAETAGHQNGVVFRQLVCRAGFNGFGIHVFDFDAHMVFHAGVAQGFVD